MRSNLLRSFAASWHCSIPARRPSRSGSIRTVFRTFARSRTSSIASVSQRPLAPRLALLAIRVELIPVHRPLPVASGLAELVDQQLEAADDRFVRGAFAG